MDNQALVNRLREICALEMPTGIRIGKGEQSRFAIQMYNDYLTPTGDSYKRQELRAHYVRTITDLCAEIAFARYTWDSVVFCSGQPGAAMRNVTWNFARGQNFTYFLTCAGKLRTPTVSEKEEWTADGAIEKKLGVGFDYSSLPQTPSVNLLLMLTWDVITFETLVSQVRSLPGLSQVGMTTELGAISHTQTPLDFPQYSGSSFKNSTFRASFLGYGLQMGRPCAIYEYECEGKLSVQANLQAGTLGQQGASFYMGKLLIDIESGDMAAGDMHEAIVATVTTSKGRKAPTQKRRRVQVERLTGIGESI